MPYVYQKIITQYLHFVFYISCWTIKYICWVYAEYRVLAILYFYVSSSEMMIKVLQYNSVKEVNYVLQQKQMYKLTICFNCLLFD